MSVQTEDAQITSTAVEIDTLRVSGRQLTLRTFRQLQRESVIDPETHEFRGTIWGWVNYFWDSNKGDLHAVWQDEGELRRFPISYLDEATSLVYIPDYRTEIKTPKPWKMPSARLEATAEDVRLVRRQKDMHNNSTLEEIYASEEFERFESTIREWNERVRAIEDEGQLFIAT